MIHEHEIADGDSLTDIGTTSKMIATEPLTVLEKQTREEYIKMSMEQNGLAKLVEELGELAIAGGKLSQTCGKLIQYPDLQLDNLSMHPDGTFLLDCLLEEMADVCAAINFVSDKLKINKADMSHRIVIKHNKFLEWDTEPKKGGIPI